MHNPEMTLFHIMYTERWTEKKKNGQFNKYPHIPMTSLHPQKYYTHPPKTLVPGTSVSTVLLFSLVILSASSSSSPNKSSQQVSSLSQIVLKKQVRSGLYLEGNMNDEWKEWFKKKKSQYYYCCYCYASLADLFNKLCVCPSCQPPSRVWRPTLLKAGVSSKQLLKRETRAKM